MLYVKKLKFTLLMSIMFSGLGFVNAQTKIGLFDNHLDIGEVKSAGFAWYNEKKQTYTIGGSGKNMWFDKDDFHYLWTTIQGDFILRTEVEFLASGVDPHRKAGWIIKNDLNSETPHVNACVHGDGLTSLQYRTTIGGETEEVVSKDSMPSVIQLERRGNEFIMSTATFGAPFVEVKTINVGINKQVYVGLYVCAHNPDILEVATFRNVRIIRPAAADIQPYRDYLGSHLEVLEVSTGHRKILHSNSNSIQAPNWTPNGEELIYNSEGRLYRYNLSNGRIGPLNTGFAIHNNNDHVLTFDGNLIGISHHNAEDNNQSTLYYLPVEGSFTPVQVTSRGAGNSYLHGWSPDNKQMLFTGHRKGQYDIYSVDILTGEEVQLTNQKTLDDGPEFSPDGIHIFFNSARTGRMQLWRMNADGSNQIQLTHDEYNDWFPHVSPDNKWIAFISFPKEIDVSDHPFYKHCLLRIMPYNGGTPKIIGYIYGGQGSINVPSWSPDSKFISFVSNSKL
jgi:Tol biopolymer transport system component